MKYLLLILLSTVSLASEVPKEIVQTVQFLQPANNNQTNFKIAEAVFKHSKEIGIDWQLFVSILYQESALTLDPQNCMKKEFNPGTHWVKTKKGKKLVHNKPKVCKDYGISQINWKTWGKRLDLDKRKLLNDVDYSIESASIILNEYKTLYGKKDKRWFLRYHSSNYRHKNEYGKFINSKHSKIKKYLISLKKCLMPEIEEENEDERI